MTTLLNKKTHQEKTTIDDMRHHGEETRPRDLFQMLQQLFLVLLFSSSPPAHALAVRPLRHRPIVISMMSSPCAPSHVLKLRGGGGGVASTAAAVSQWYLGKLTTAPLRTKSLTLLCISCLSDTLSQRITEHGVGRREGHRVGVVPARASHVDEIGS